MSNAPGANSDQALDGPLDTAILFVDLVSSSEFASVLGLKEYAEYVDSFEAVCLDQCRYFFEVLRKDQWKRGIDYDYKFLGDELVVFMHTGKPHNDVYQLIRLAVALKCGWLGAPINASRVERGAPSAELAAGINFGSVWAAKTSDGYKKRGYSINVAKRIESASREGQYFRILVSNQAIKRAVTSVTATAGRLRTLIFGPRKIIQMKGVVAPVGVTEVVESFIDLTLAVEPEQLERFRKTAVAAIEANSFDLWIHSCYQVLEEKRNGKKVSDDCMMLCQRILGIDPTNASALHHMAQGAREREDLASARLYLEDLTSAWPGFADGWLELGKVLKQLNELEAAHTAILQARRNGVTAEEAAAIIATPLG